MIRLYGRRVMLRPLVPGDFAGWSEVRIRNGEWLTNWEPLAPPGQGDPSRDRGAFDLRCSNRERDRQMGNGYGFGIFVDGTFAGEINLNNVVRGAFQNAHIGYWIDRARAGNSYMSEAVVVITRFAFESLHLHRAEINIVPRNTNSRRVMEKLLYRAEGISERFLEIAGTWEDHMRYAITLEEWLKRRDELTAAWL
jgi:[ribosomal protein S5]-alanine N-acetyltransferase